MSIEEQNIDVLATEQKRAGDHKGPPRAVPPTSPLRMMIGDRKGHLSGPVRPCMVGAGLAPALGRCGGA